MNAPRNDPAAWSAYVLLHDSVWAITFHLEHAIAACNLIAERLLKGDEVDYFSGSPPESAVVIRFRESPPAGDRVEHLLRLSVELMRDQYIPLFWDKLKAANSALDNLPADLQDNLNAVADRWVIHTRRCLNNLAKPYRPPGSFLELPDSEAGFPRNVSDAIDICKRRLSRAGWCENLQRIRERWEQLKSCEPPSKDVKPDDPSKKLTTGENALTVVFGETANKVFQIASSSETADNKMRKICDIDAIGWGWKSPVWANLLGVTAPAIRKTEFWKVDRPKQFEGSRAAWKSKHPDEGLPDELRSLGE